MRHKVVRSAGRYSILAPAREDNKILPRRAVPSTRSVKGIAGSASHMESKSSVMTSNDMTADPGSPCK